MRREFLFVTGIIVLSIAFGVALVLSVSNIPTAQDDVIKANEHWKHWRNIHAKGTATSCYESGSFLICTVSKNPTWHGPKTVVCSTRGCKVE